jgi:hypothetical protein
MTTRAYFYYQFVDAGCLILDHVGTIPPALMVMRVVVRAAQLWGLVMISQKLLHRGGII